MEQAATPIYDELFEKLITGAEPAEEPAATEETDAEATGRRHREAS